MPVTGNLRNPSRVTLFFLLVLAMNAWGGSWVSAKMIAGMQSPEVLTFWRFLFTFISFVPVMWFFRKPLNLNRAGLWKVIVGAMLIVSYNHFFFLGLRFGLAGAGGVLVTTFNPTLTVILGVLFLRKEIQRNQVFGLIFGLCGGSILLEIWKLNTMHMLQSGNAYFLVASSSWAILTLISERSRQNISPMVFSFYVYGLAALFDLPFAIGHGVLSVFDSNLAFWVNILFLSLFATTFATTVYFFASGRLGSQVASSFIFLVPVSAVLLSWGLLDETPQLHTLVGGIVAITAVYLLNVNTKKVDSVIENMP